MFLVLRVLTISLGLAGLAWSMQDPATGITFPSTRHDLEIMGVGVRKKGPIKIYSVAMYCSSVLKSKLADISKSNQPKEALQVLRQGAKQDPTTFLLQMNFKVGGAKMASAIADSVTPRHSGNQQQVEALKTLIFNGVQAKGGDATKGTTLQFDCSPDKVAVAVDGKNQGEVHSNTLSQAFCDVYLDDKCVSPALRQSCMDHCCAP